MSPKPAADPMSDTPGTPTPWEVVRRDDPRGQPVPYYRGLICTVEHSPDRYIAIVTKDGRSVTREEWPNNAELIVLAVNSHATLVHQRDALVKALERIGQDCDALVGLGNDKRIKTSAGELESYKAFASVARATLASIKE